MKIGAVGFGNRIAHVYFELKEINKDAQMIAFVDPTPIGKKFAIEKNIFPSKQYNSLEEMLGNEELELLMKMVASTLGDRLQGLTRQQDNIMENSTCPLPAGIGGACSHIIRICMAQWDTN